MTEAPTISSEQATRIGPGRVILVVGPSGAGKDTLLGLAKAACADDPDSSHVVSSLLVPAARTLRRGAAPINHMIWQLPLQDLQ